METPEEAPYEAPESISAAIEAEPLAEPLPECARRAEQPAEAAAISGLEREQQEREERARALAELEAAIAALESGGKPRLLSWNRNAAGQLEKGLARLAEVRRLRAANQGR